MALGAAQRDVMPLPATAAPSQSRPSTLEFTAVVLASVSDGDGLYPLTENIPPALLPVANRPLLSFQLEMLERAMSFSQVLVLTTERWLPLLSTWVSEQYKGPLEVELLVVPDDAGSADALRHIRAKLTTDFVLLAGDVITDVPFQRMADLHRLQGAAATALFREVAARAAGVAKKEKDLAGIDFVGVDETGQRILSLEAAADCDGVVSISQSLLRAYPHVQLRTDLVDAHVYIFAPWVLDVLEQKPHFSSAKFELLPYLVRKQFLSKANLPPSRTRTPRAAARAAAPRAVGRTPLESAHRSVERRSRAWGPLWEGWRRQQRLSLWAIALGGRGGAPTADGGERLPLLLLCCRTRRGSTRCVRAASRSTCRRTSTCRANHASRSTHARSRTISASRSRRATTSIRAATRTLPSARRSRSGAVVHQEGVHRAALPSR